MFTGLHDIHNRPKHGHKGKVTTAQIDWELKELIRIYEDLCPLHVLEIGSQFGGTLWYWIQNAVPDCYIVNIDILQNMSDEDKLELPNTWCTWADEQGVNFHPMIGRSDDPAIRNHALEYLDWSIDFLFIDAVHTYEGAKSDFELYGPYVLPGGIIALHDIEFPESKPHIQVGRLWKEIQEAGYVTRELRAKSWWGGIGVVYV